jgi:hypothetical protein
MIISVSISVGSGSFALGIFTGDVDDNFLVGGITISVFRGGLRGIITGVV